MLRYSLTYVNNTIKQVKLSDRKGRFDWIIKSSWLKDQKKWPEQK